MKFLKQQREEIIRERLCRAKGKEVPPSMSYVKEEENAATTLKDSVEYLCQETARFL